MNSGNKNPRTEINRIFPHQIMLPISSCLGQNGRLHQLYLTNNNRSQISRSAVIRDTENVVYCFKEREDALQFFHHFGGVKINQVEMDGQLCFRF